MNYQAIELDLPNDFQSMTQHVRVINFGRIRVQSTICTQLPGMFP